METECYPCIPMHSASNQKRMNHSTVTMIKTEPLSEDVNVNIVDHEDNSEFRNSSSLRKTTRNRRSLIAAAASNNTTTTSQQQHRIHQHTIRLSRVSQILQKLPKKVQLGFSRKKSLKSQIPENSDLQFFCRKNSSN